MPRLTTQPGSRATRRTLTAALALAASSGMVMGQDSVAVDGGQNDALSAQAPGQQRVRYVVDLTPVTSSWGLRYVVGPVLKASRDLDPMFHTNILGAGAISPTHHAPSAGVTLPADRRDFAFWSAPGQGVHPQWNTAPSQTLTVGTYQRRFGVAFNDFAVGPNNVVGAVIGQNGETLADLRRLYIERTTGATSRLPAQGLNGDTFRVSMGGVDHTGLVSTRMDGFQASSDAVFRILGENIVLLHLPRRLASAVASPPPNNPPPYVNVIINQLGENKSFLDTGSTFFAVDGSEPPAGEVQVTLKTPVSFASGGGQFNHFVAFDFKSRLITGTHFNPADSPSLQKSTIASAFRAPQVAGVRGGPSYSGVTALGGNLGTVASLAVGTASSTARVDRINVFALEASPLPFEPPRVVAGSPLAAVMPSPIATLDGAFEANEENDAEFRHWLGATTFLGPSGLVGIGTTKNGRLVLAATATDPEHGEFIAVATRENPIVGGWSWQVAAHVGMPVRSGPTAGGVGTSVIGAIVAGSPTGMSSPAADLLGNIYFTARWRQSGASTDQTGFFRAVRTPDGYELERLLTTGQTVQGQNSATPYVVRSIALADGQGPAPGSFHAGSVLQSMIPGREIDDPRSAFAFGGAVVQATIAYQRGVEEIYEAMLFVGPYAAGLTGDATGDGEVGFADLALVLSQLGQSGDGLQGDLNGDGVVDFVDLLLVLENYGSSM